MEGQCLALRDLTTPRKRVSAPGEDSDDEGRGDHKENMYTGKRSTPLKSAESAIPALLMSRRGAAPDPMHITPIKHGALAEPWTPTANLKMLISAASPDIRDREMKKVLFRPIENDGDAARQGGAGDEDDHAQLDAVEEEEEEEDAERKPSRKQKSLGLLCQKFLALYPDYPPPDPPIWISLDEVANNLGVERRRIYDIVNVLESLMIVGRIAKNSYTWYGRQQLEATLQELQQRGLQHGYHLQMELAGAVAGSGPGCEEDGAEGDAGNAGSNRKDKSLRIMSQKFVMLFLVSKTQTVTLDAAAKVLIEEGQDSSSHSKYKTKVRRLYDIANVLTSLGLIKKVHVREERGRKPAFKWLGPVEFGTAGSAVAAVGALSGPARDLRGSVARHASFHVAPSSGAALRRVSSAPSSPRRDPTGLQHQPVDYSKKTASTSVVGQLQFGDHADAPLRTVCAAAAGPAPPPASRTALVTPHLFAAAPGPPPRHCVAYLPSLSQPSVVMLYRAPGEEEGKKRDRGEEEEEEEEVETMAMKKRRSPASDESNPTRAESQQEAAEYAPAGASPTRLPTEHAHASHFLYVPNTPGFNGLNLLLSAEPSSAGVALPPGGVPALGPYILVPSHYPLVTGGLQPNSAGELGYGVSAVMPPAHFVVGASHYGLAAAAATSPTSAPEQRGLHGAGTALSPSGRHHSAGVTREDVMTPRTPKETASSSSSSSAAFFQTPGAQGSTVGAAPAARKRASAQRRLDIGQPLGS